jgi:hypothetical protein
MDLEKILDPLGPVNTKWLRPIGKGERAQESRETINVVAVEVTDEDRLELAPMEWGFHQLELSPLAAVEEKGLALVFQGHRR